MQQSRQAGNLASLTININIASKLHLRLIVVKTLAQILPPDARQRKNALGICDGLMVRYFTIVPGLALKV